MDNWNEFDDPTVQIAFSVIQLAWYIEVLEENSKQDKIYREETFYYLSSNIVQYTQANFQVKDFIQKSSPFSSNHVS